MSYAGVCGADDEQTNSDPVFNQFSIGEIQTYVRTASIPGYPNATNGGTIVATQDHSPVVTVPAAQSIPPLTPFTLSGTATDADSNALTYTWEQNDNQASGDDIALLDNNKTSGPLFSEFPHPAVLTRNDNDDTYNEPGENYPSATANVRTYPNIEDIASGNTNAATGSCPTPSQPATTAQIACYTNFLAPTARTLHFDLTARDNAATGGGVATSEGVVSVVGAAPFAVTSTTSAALGNTSTTVTWNTAGTTSAPFNVANVKISYSTDGGLTFPSVLAPSTPNNGTAAVTLPATQTTTGRFKVEAIGQPFFDISHNNLAVTQGPVTAPGAPTGVTATPAGTQLSVAFTAPADNGGSAITGYTVTATPTNGAPVTATGTSSPITVPGLAKGTTYSVTVAATNAIGKGPASSPPATAAIAATTPGVPTGVTATPVGAQLSVAFTAPADNGGSAVTGYTVTATPTSGTPVTATGTTSPIPVPGLGKGVTYSVVVAAANAVGKGPASSPPVTATIAATVPGVPTGVMVSPGDGKLLATFAAPADSGGSSITGYTVTATPASGAAAAVTGTASPLTLTGLTNGTSYTVTVKATNAVGTGATSPGVAGIPVSAAPPLLVVPSLKVQASKAFVTLGSQVKLTGVLARNAVGVAGEDVTLFVTYSDGVTHTLGATKTDAQGDYSFTNKPLYNGSFFTRALGVTSGKALSRVILTYRSAKATVRGNTVTVTADTRPGFVTSASRRERVQLLLVDGNGRQLKVLATTDARQRTFPAGELHGTNAIIFPAQTLPAGTYHLVVKVIGTPVNTGASSKRLRVSVA